MKTPLKLKVFTWYLRRDVILAKDNLVKRNWHMEVLSVYFVHNMRQKNLYFECTFAGSMWSSIQIASNSYPPKSVAIFLITGYMTLVTSLELLVG